jgi:hypothetical protein
MTEDASGRRILPGSIRSNAESALRGALNEVIERASKAPGAAQEALKQVTDLKGRLSNCKLSTILKLRNEMWY